MNKLRATWEKHWYAWAFVAPVVIVLAVLIGYPLVQGIAQSFTNLTEANQAAEICQKTLGGGQSCEPNPHQARFVGLQNYTDLLTGRVGEFWHQLLITLIWTAACVFLHYTLGLGLAILLNREMRFRGLYRVLLILPWAIPAFVSAFAWKFIYDRDAGIVNAAIRALGGQSIDFFDSTPKALLAVIVVNVWLGVPFMMVALLGGLQSIPAELHEAAEMDGASPWQRFVHVTLPGLRPVSNSVILLGTIWTFNMFPIIFLVSRGGPSGGTEILVTGAYRAAFEGVRNYGFSAAYGVVILSILIVYSMVYRRALRKQGEVW
ncbi:carbohydrate ABC transporter membrane protein 1, CUT1 family [Austwickia chelonae]|uniref:Putative ABC transporter permease protein n=1 Tax=Austwickia chelonae NBRC 105200 TaxID=1184607 RepID=K6VR47_9MICO|nr:sugar ABC transporter permease [Austwickia chelonae]GAB77840.1 putative ABC transporter permease protein [Austwickia chelonae NBRC 105200]SEV90595.1 carbohydrate ABC transporter membrane protein 1, CUT1 family [Austwickia chelonae]